MKKLLRILRILIVILFVLVIGFFFYGKLQQSRYLNSENSFILTNPTSVSLDTSDISQETQEVNYVKSYENNLVQLTIDTHTGTGLVWQKNDTEIIIVSNAHLLENGSTALVTLSSGESYEGEVIGTAYDYDIGFVRLVNDDIKNISSLFYDSSVTEEYIKELIDNKTAVMHIGINTKKLNDEDPIFLSFKGSLKDYIFKPEFYEMMIVSEGSSKPGMSGGMVITKDGIFIGLLSGGEELEDGTFVTYSVPACDIPKAYGQIY